MNPNTMPLEAETRVLIDRSLENLGWKLSGKDQNVYYEQPRSEAEKKKLCGKRPDYVLYSKDSDKPLIVIEAKKKGVRLDSALEQGIQYAKAIEAPLVFATDGVFCKAFHTVANRPPILNGEEIDEFIREALALRYLTSYEVNTVSPKVQYDRKELIRIFDEANNMLRGEGLRAGIERFGEFANILFLKLISESEQIKRESGIPTKFEVACSWDSIKQIPISTRIEYINKTVYDKLNLLYDTDIFTPLQIRDASILKEIMDKLDPLMTYIYCTAWKIGQIEPERYKDAIVFARPYNGRERDLKIEDADSIFAYSLIPEKDIARLFKIIGLDRSQISAVGELVDTRNEMAHASGKFEILTEEGFDAKASSVFTSISCIHSCMDKLIRKWCKEVLLSFCCGEYDGYDNPKDVIAEQMIQSFKLSVNELLVCNEMSVSSLITEHRGYQTKLKDFKKAISDHCQEMGYI